MRVIAIGCLLAIPMLSGCGPAEGSPEWCRQMMNKPQSAITPHQAMVLSQKCIGEMMK